LAGPELFVASGILVNAVLDEANGRNNQTTEQHDREEHKQQRRSARVHPDA
jgi:hypothetical protein